MRLRGRFTLWFLLAALIPIVAAALLIRDRVSRSYKNEYDRLRSETENTVKREIARGENAVKKTVKGLASPKSPFVGRFVANLEKNRGRVTTATLDELGDYGQLFVDKLRLLDVLFVVDERGATNVLVAPHSGFSLIGQEYPKLRDRAQRLKGDAYYMSEPTMQRGKGKTTVKNVFVVESAQRVNVGGYRLTIVGGRKIGAELLASVRSPNRIDARIVDAKGKLLVRPAEAWDAEYSSFPPIRIALAGPGGKPVAWVEVLISDAQLSRLLKQVTISAFVLAGGALFVTFLLGFIVARRMTRNLDKLVVGAQAAARGDLEHRVEVRQRDEIGAVADALNTMMEDLVTSKDRLVIAQRIAAWQEIARRLAHEIKNPLTPIQMSVETLRKTWEKKHPSFEETFVETTTTVLEETARLKRIVAEFSEFARMPKPQIKALDLNELINHTLSLYEGTIEIVKNLDDTLPEIHADKDQLSQVILNLVENARDAVSQHADKSDDSDGAPAGRIVITTRFSADSGMVEMTIDDNGPGIEASLRPKLFTPYFTTKQLKGGTGLGLAIVHRIVTDHGGRIIAADSPEGGARFVATWPVIGEVIVLTESNRI